VSKRDSEPPLEWAAGILGALIFCAMIVVLVTNALSGADAPPNVRAHVEDITPVRDGYVVEFAAENAGDKTAADVAIIAELANGEHAEARLDFLPPHSVRRGGVFFQTDPRAGAMTLRAEGYADP
jgi:uncharacterized protein (TIGR02588 family)